MVDVLSLLMRKGWIARCGAVVLRLFWHFCDLHAGDQRRHGELSLDGAAIPTNSGMPPP